MKTKRNGNSILLCCGKGKCPSLSKSADHKKHYDLKDDFGGTVSLTKEQLLAIKEALGQLDGN